jgi:hypothetical protein
LQNHPIRFNASSTFSYEVAYEPSQFQGLKTAHETFATQTKRVARRGRWEEKERNKKLPARTPGIICMELPTRTSGGAK